MSEAWSNFGILLLVQFLIFLSFAFYEKKLTKIGDILGKGILIGIPLGLFFDLVVGKFLGLSIYALGFGALFLLPNGAFSYGIFAATILLLRHHRPLYFCISTLFITVLYEVVNLFLHVWEWRFPVPTFLFPVVLGVGYIAGAILVIRIFDYFNKKVLR